MKKVFYLTLLILVIQTEPSFSCPVPPPTIHQEIVWADYVAKVKFAKRSNHSISLLKSPDGDYDLLQAAYDFSVIQNFKGDLKPGTFYSSLLQYVNLQGEELILGFSVYGEDTIVVSHDFTSGYLNYLERYELNEEGFKVLCEGLDGVCSFEGVNDRQKAFHATLRAASTDNAFTLFNSFDRSCDQVGGQTELIGNLAKSIKQEQTQKAKDLFKQCQIKPYLIVDLMEALKLADFTDVLTGHLINYYCEATNSAFDSYSPYYAQYLEHKLMDHSSEIRDKAMIAAFMKTRLMHTEWPVLLEKDVEVFNDLYPQANLTTELPRYQSDDISYDEWEKVANNIIERIVSYQPLETEPKLRTNFCTNEGGEIPKLKFSLAPNPTTGPVLLHVQDVNPEERIFVEVHNANGELMKGLTIQPFNATFSRELSFDDLAPGSYYLRVYNRFSTDAKMFQVN